MPDSFWRPELKRMINIKFHIYCNRCKNYIGMEEEYDLIVMCKKCADQLQKDLKFLTKELGDYHWNRMDDPYYSISEEVNNELEEIKKRYNIN